MQNNHIDNIISILNADSSLEEKRAALIKEKCHYKESNATILSIIIEVLSECALPLNFDDALSIYSLDEIDSNGYDVILSIANSSSCHYFNAIAFELAWKHFHKIDLADKAINYYFDSLQSINNNYVQTSIVAAICRIYAKTKTKGFNLSKFQQFCLNSLIPNYPVSERYTEITLRSLLMATGDNDIERHVLSLIKTKEAKRDYYSAIDLTEILSEAYKKAKRTVDKQNLKSRLAKYYEAAANQLNWDDPQNAHRIIHLIQKAMSLWSASKSPDAVNERKRLAKRIDPVKKLSLETIKCVTSEEFDLTDTINKMRSLVKDASFEKCIWNFIHVANLISPQKLKKQNQKDNYFFSSFFETTILDSDGRKKCIVPSLRNTALEDQEHLLEHDAEKEYSIYADALISRYLYIIKERFTFTEENLKFIVENNALIPQDRQKSFLKGLVAGFEYDYITALSILMPQIENAIRNLASDCGAVVYKTYDNGVEECLSLEAILNLPEMKKYIDPVYMFNFKLFYTSEYGFGMRNTVCHGLASDAELSSCQGLIVWWFTLRICCIYSRELIKRISQECIDHE